MHGLWLTPVVAPVHRTATIRMTALVMYSLVASSYGKVIQV